MIYKSKQNTFHMDANLIERIESSLNSGYAVTVTNRGDVIDFSYRSRMNNGAVQYDKPENIHLPNSTIAFVEEIINGGNTAEIKVERDRIVTVRITRKVMDRALIS